VLLYARTTERQKPMQALQRLCSSPDADPWPLFTSAEAFASAGRSGAALKVLKQALRTKSCNPQVATAAIQLLLTRDAHLSAMLLFSKLKPGEAQHRAASVLVEGLGKGGYKWFLRWLLWRHRAVLLSDDAAWGQVGYALSSWKWMRKAAAWLGDWRSRKKVEPWMVFNLCYALRELGRYDEATALAQESFERWGAREGHADMRLFLGLEKILQGRLTEAVSYLKPAKPRTGVLYDQELYAIAKALVQFLQAGPAERKAVVKSTRRSLATRFTDLHLLIGSRDVLRTFRRASRVFAREGAGWRSRL
jgi:tetratricopeptide (TPR) repeat protein